MQINESTPAPCSDFAEQRATQNKLAVFFDGACPLCQREIAWYRKQAGANNIDWIDVARRSPGTESRLAGLGLSREQALQRFHVQRSDGELLSGGKAFIELWFELPRFRLPARLLAFPPLAWITDRLYDLSLLIRPAMQRLARKRGKCDAGKNSCDI
ncbi:MAG: DUF393 domain-containing protein [Pseudomonadales bacterium]